jgi:pantoate--beta-alanine ligase
MQIIRSVQALSAWSRALHREGVVIGMVPTMGALHAGHRSLIRKARLSCDAVVVSLFVNPRQFRPGEDFFRYPRPARADAALCRAEGVDVLFMPTREAMYPQGFQTSVVVRDLAKRWEGERRPGHFDGVTTIVTKLFSLVRPQLAFFGQKDFQQTVLVRRLAEDLNLDVKVRVCPTVRDSDGLALSSRNQSLTPEQRRAAPILYSALRAGRAAILRGIRSAARISHVMHETVAGEPSVSVDYLAVSDPDTLAPVTRVTKAALLHGAIRLGRIRLIDNLIVKCLT